MPPTKTPDDSTLESKSSDCCQEDGQVTCEDEVKETVLQTPRLISAEVNRNAGSVAVKFNAEGLDAFQTRLAAERLRPAAQRMLDRCVFRLKGKGCESCAQRLGYNVSRQEGVRTATASFVGGVLSVTYDSATTSPEQILESTRRLGADVKDIDEAIREESGPAPFAATWMARIRNLFAGEHRNDVLLVLVTLAAMTVSGILEASGAPILVWAIGYVIAYLAGGYEGTKEAISSVRQGVVDIDMLMILAALGAAAIGYPFEGAMLLFLFAFSNLLQELALERSRNAIRALAKMRPQTARILNNGTTEEMSIDDVYPGDLMELRPGDRVPLDGIVTEGESSLDQSSVTGESMPVNKAIGDEIFAGTFNQFGNLTVRVTRAAKDSTIARMIRLVEEAQGVKAQTQRFLEKTEQQYAIAVIAFTLLLIFTLPLIFSVGWGDALYRAITVMVVASPCALIISIPATILSAIAAGARKGILFKGGVYLEQAATIQTLAFDKTGTLTRGEPVVTDVVNCSDFSLQELLRLVTAVEDKSEHPLARAIVRHAKAKGIAPVKATSFYAHAGKGAEGNVDGRRVLIGTASWIYATEDITGGNDEVSRQLSEFQDSGKTSVVVAVQSDAGYVLAGIIAMADELREDSAQIVDTLRASGVEHITMLTGDNERVARSVAKKCKIDDVYFELLPEDKLRVVRELAKTNNVAMVGDGTNDAPALASATVGIAMGAAGSDVALESADIVLMSNDLNKIGYLIRLSRQARRVMVQNLAFAGGVIVLMVIATLLLPLVGATVPLPLGVLAHEGGTVLVCLNGLRMLWFK